MTTSLAIIGGTGFIGRAVADAAAEAGFEPVLLAPGSPEGAQAHAPGAPVIDCDVTDKSSVGAALRDLSPAAVVHLAAFGAGAHGLLAGASADPQGAIAINVTGLVNVVQCAAEVSVDRVVWSSSTTVYGPADRYGRTAVAEDGPPAPQSVYGATKAAAELLSPSLEAQTGVRPVALRLPLVYGPGRWYGGSQEGLVGFVADVAAGRPAQLEADSQDADWIYVTDAAAAFLAAVSAPHPAHVYNLVGHRSSLADVGHAVATHARTEAEVLVRADGGLPPLPPVDDAAARRDLGFTPRFDLSAGAADYVARLRAIGQHHADTD